MNSKKPFQLFVYYKLQISKSWLKKLKNNYYNKYKDYSLKSSFYKLKYNKSGFNLPYFNKKKEKKVIENNYKKKI